MLAAQLAWIWESKNKTEKRQDKENDFIFEKRKRRGWVGAFGMTLYMCPFTLPLYKFNPSHQSLRHASRGGASC